MNSVGATNLEKEVVGLWTERQELKVGMETWMRGLGEMGGMGEEAGVVKWCCLIPSGRKLADGDIHFEGRDAGAHIGDCAAY